MLADQPEHVVAVEHAPDGRERIAQPEVDAAHPAAVSRRLLVGPAAREGGVYETFQRLEAAAELLAIPRFPHLPAHLFQVARLDARNFLGRHLDARPVVAATRPGVVE